MDHIASADKLLDMPMKVHNNMHLWSNTPIYKSLALRHAENELMTVQVSINVRFLLWRRKIARAEWGTWLVTRTPLRPEMCRRLLQGRLPDAEISSGHLRALAEAFGLEEEIGNLRFADLPRDQGRVLAENLRFLFTTLGHGGKKALATELGIDPTTISRWLSGTYEPQPASLHQIVSYFGLPSDTDLQEDPIFLSAEPLSASERRQWLNSRINALTSEELRELFPVLCRLLEER